MRKKYIKIPKYLFYLPYLAREEYCDECGSKKWVWKKKGFIVVGYIKQEISPLQRYYSKVLLGRGETSLVYKFL